MRHVKEEIDENLKKISHDWADSYFGYPLVTLDIRSASDDLHIKYLRVPYYEVETIKIVAEGTMAPKVECKISESTWNKDFLVWNDRECYRILAMSKKQVDQRVRVLQKQIDSLTHDECEGCALNARGQNLPFSCYGPQCYGDDPFHCSGPTKDDSYKKKFWKDQADRYGTTEETLKENLQRKTYGRHNWNDLGRNQDPQEQLD